ncbi:MAG: DUF58 domain-containing protein [Geminicoccaceae bacterium]
MPVETRPHVDRQHFDAIRIEAERHGDRLPGLMVEADRVARTVFQGVHGRRRTGVGETFWQYRPYQPGEPANQIDWRQSAKSRHLFVRQQEWEAAQSVWLWVDQSASMRFRSSETIDFKHERALLLALALASLLVRGGEQIAVLGTGRRPAAGRHALERFARDLLAAGDEQDGLPSTEGLRADARIVLVSDWLQPPEPLAEDLARLAARRAKTVMLHMVDPAEESLPFDGRTLFRGLEREGEALFGNVRDIRERYVALFDAHCGRLDGLCRRFGWSRLRHRTDHSATSGLLSLYQLMSHAQGGR